MDKEKTTYLQFAGKVAKKAILPIAVAVAAFYVGSVHQYNKDQKAVQGEIINAMTAENLLEQRVLVKTELSVASESPVVGGIASWFDPNLATPYQLNNSIQNTQE
jgi:hypothetical protein